MKNNYIKGLVSIVTPCYNTGAILHRLFDSILSQDYPSIEMYAINDGSSDNTEDVIKSYIPKFETKGYKLECINQPHGGQSRALNNGLKFVKGEFFIWPDSDDYFSSPQSISKFVETLLNHEDISVARCLPSYVDEDTLAVNRVEAWKEEYASYNHFENCLYCEKFFWGAGDYMIRTEAFDKANPSREIYIEKRAGQNWQILLPSLYGNKCMTIKESLFCILERTGSHCRADNDSYSKQVERFACYDRTVVGTLERINVFTDKEREAYIREVQKRANKRNLQIAINFDQRKVAIRLLKTMPFSFNMRDIKIFIQSLFRIVIMH